MFTVPLMLVSIVSIGLNSEISIFFNAAAWMTMCTSLLAISSLSLSNIFPNRGRNLTSLILRFKRNSEYSSISKTLTAFTGYWRIFFAKAEPKLPAPPVMRIFLFFNNFLRNKFCLWDSFLSYSSTKNLYVFFWIMVYLILYCIKKDFL